MAISAVLEQEPDEDYNLDLYLYENIDKEKNFYVIEKQFWDEWSDEPKKSKQVKPTIDNNKFISPDHSLRWRDELLWKQDFVVVPKCVFRALSKWYQCNKMIELTVTK